MAGPPLAVTVLSAVLAAVGIGLGVGGVVVVRRYRRVRRADPTEVTDVSAGLAAVEGRAREREGLVTAPVSGTDCLAYTVEVERYVPSWAETYHQLSSEAGTVEFLVEDSTGEARVDPEGAKLLLEQARQVELGRDDTPPERIQRYFEAVGVAHESGAGPRLATSLNPQKGLSPGQTHRLTERRLDPDESVYAVGAARGEDGSVRISQSVDREGWLGILEASLRTPLVLASGTDDLEAQTSEQVQTGWLLLVLGVASLCFGVALQLGIA